MSGFCLGLHVSQCDRSSRKNRTVDDDKVFCINLNKNDVGSVEVQPKIQSSRAYTLIVTFFGQRITAQSRTDCIT